MLTPGGTRAEIDTPALVVDLDVMERNIATMTAFFRDRPAKLRPHFKSPKAPAIARRLLAAGAIGMTCAKVSEAEVLAQHGIRDILIANQVVGAQKLIRLANLAQRTAVIVAVDSLDGVDALAAAADGAGVQIGAVVEVDVGMHRCGVRSPEAALNVAQRIRQSTQLRFAGVMGYEGHTVMTADRTERERAATTAMTRLIQTVDHLRATSVPVDIVSAGGTGTYDITGTFPGVTEVQAGSFIMMDARYREVDVPFACALSLVTTVLSVPDARSAIIDAGMKSVTFEFGLPVVKDLADVSLVFLSEEHGHLATNGTAMRVGQRVELLPTHSDTTINLHDRIYAARDDRIEAIFTIDARGCCQ